MHHTTPYTTSPFAMLPAATASSAAAANVTTLAPALTYTPPASSPAELDLSHLASSPHDSITSPPSTARTPPLVQTGGFNPATRKRSSTPPTSPLCKIDEEAAHEPSSARRLGPRHASSGSIGGGAAPAVVVVPHHPAPSASLTVVEHRRQLRRPVRRPTTRPSGWAAASAASASAPSRSRTPSWTSSRRARRRAATCRGTRRSRRRGTRRASACGHRWTRVSSSAFWASGCGWAVLYCGFWWGRWYYEYMIRDGS